MDFLYLLVAIWLLVASFLDLKYREIPNWLSFSMAAFGLSYAAFRSGLELDLWPFLFSLFGFALFFLIAYALYYGRVFAGGDAKLLIGLGPLLPQFSGLGLNFSFMFLYILLVLVVGGVYGLGYSFFVAILNRKKFVHGFLEEINFKRVGIFLALASLPAILSLVLWEPLFLFFSCLLFIFPFLLSYSKAIEKCMVIEKNVENLSVGDWLEESVKAGDKEIGPGWEGLSEKEIKILGKERDSVKVKDGIPFVPSFLFAFLILIYLRNSSWFVDYFWLLRFLF